MQAAAKDDSTLRFLHLSDLHFAADDHLNAALKERFAFIKKTYPNHYLIISGDIIDNEGKVRPGTKIPVELGQELLEDALASPPPPFGPIEPHLKKTRQALENARKTISLFPTDRVYFCAGNHDFGLWGNIYDQAFAQAFDDLLWKPLNNNHLVLPFGPSDIFGPTQLSAQTKRPILYPIVAPSGPGVRLIALNTCPDFKSLVSPVTLAKGIVGGEQARALEQGFLPETIIPGLPDVLGLHSITIMFFHHHPWIHTDASMKLVDSEELLRIIRGKVDLILFGHRHMERRYPPNAGPTLQIKHGALAAGSSRFETHVWQISFTPPKKMDFTKVRIV